MEASLSRMTLNNIDRIINVEVNVKILKESILFSVKHFRREAMFQQDNCPEYIIDQKTDLVAIGLKIHDGNFSKKHSMTKN